MKKWITLVLLMGMISLCQAQETYQSVVFDYEKSAFNEGQPLPAGSYFMMRGEIVPAVEMVKVLIYAASSDQLLYQAQWKRSAYSESNTFQVPIRYKLKSDQEYDLRISYFKTTADSSRSQLREQLFGFLDAYVDQVVVVEKNKIRLNTPVNRIKKHLNEIVKRGITYYDNRSAIEFPGFSDLVTTSLQAMRNKDITPGKYYEPDSAASRQGRKYNYAEDQITSLKTLIHSEVASVLNTDLAGLYDTKMIYHYRTERISNIFTLNAGYGAVYLDGDVNNLSYDSAPMAGISFPFGSRLFPSRFFTKTSLSLGVFLTNFKNEQEQTLTGPIVGRPVYAGLGYSIVDFLRVTAGATFLQNSATAPDGVNLKSVSVRPYIGLTLDINVWLGIGSKSSPEKK